MKRLLTLGLSIVMVFTLTTPVFAAESIADPQPVHAITVDLDQVDFTKPFTKSFQVDTRSETPATVTLEFTPAPQTRGSSTNEASEGTWTSKYTIGIFSMSYQFDLEKVRSQWRMSNPRNHMYSGLFTSFSDPSLEIVRAQSTDTFPCEIDANVTATYFDNQWITIGTDTWFLYTTVTHDGTMTLNW